MAFQLKALDIPEEAWAVYNELVDGLITIVPTAECEEFVKAASGYLVKVSYNKGGVPKSFTFFSFSKYFPKLLHICGLIRLN